MSQRRILSIWVPNLAIEHVLRHAPERATLPYALTTEIQGAITVASLTGAARAQGIHKGMSLSDARALCPDMLSQTLDPLAEAHALAALTRWAGRFSPWVTTDGRDGLLADISGCAHLFGGEEALARQIESDGEALQLTLSIGIADTIGAAWAVARFAGQASTGHRSGDAIDQEARATRSRAHRRRNWERGGPAPANENPAPHLSGQIIPAGQIRETLARLPIAALRLSSEEAAPLIRLGLRHIGDLAALPRASLARRFGLATLRRLDQALGAEPEPLSPKAPDPVFAVRLTLPDPIGLEDDIMAGIDRLLPALSKRLTEAGRAARRIRLTALGSDRSRQTFVVGLARPSRDPLVIRPLLHQQIKALDAGFGIDTLRLEALQTEAWSDQQHSGPVTTRAAGRQAALAGLINRIGVRIGMDNILRLSPAESHLPEKCALLHPAAFCDPVTNWPRPQRPRPLYLFRPELITPQDTAQPPRKFRWRRRDHIRTSVRGPERIAPEWWLDDPAWRSGIRDYWQIDTDAGQRLWLFEARSDEMPGGWFIHGSFS